jgi:ferredoxin
MSVVKMNDHQYEGQPGERLVDVARNNGEHFGFLCDGTGFCQLCMCRVMEGTEHLNEPTPMEKAWINESMLDDGYRLACQVSLQGPGPIEVVGRPEEIRRQLVEVYSPPEGTNSAENASRLFNTLGRYVGNQVGRFPFNVLNSLSVMMQSTPRVPNVPKIMGDAGRVVQTMTTGGQQRAEEQSGSAQRQLPSGE